MVPYGTALHGGDGCPAGVFSNRIFVKLLASWSFDLPRCPICNFPLLPSLGRDANELLLNENGFSFLSSSLRSSLQFTSVESTAMTTDEWLCRHRRSILQKKKPDNCEMNLWSLSLGQTHLSIHLSIIYHLFLCRVMGVRGAGDGWPFPSPHRDNHSHTRSNPQSGESVPSTCHAALKFSAVKYVLYEMPGEQNFFFFLRDYSTARALTTRNVITVKKWNSLIKQPCSHADSSL